MAERTVEMRREGGVAVVTYPADPRGGPDARTRTDLDRLLAGLDADPDLRAVVLSGRPGAGSAGDGPPDAPDSPVTLAALARRIETARQPVVGVVRGAALAAGAELALACHWRLADPGARFGLPQVRLGLLPSAGGGQRLLRWAGVATALEMLLGGQAVTAERALRTGLVDGIGAGDAAAVTFAGDLAGRGAGPRPASAHRRHMADPKGNMALLRAAREAASGDPRTVVPLVLSCVEAGLLLPWEQTLTFEEEASARARVQPQARALRHLALAERRRPPGVLADPPGTGATPAARAAALRQLEAVALAAQALARHLGEPAIDGAMVAAGFEEGPFGGREAVADAAIWRVLLAIAVAEGAAMVEAGLLPSAAAVDLAAVHAGGFPRLTGGPMWAGQALGPARLVRELDALRSVDPHGPWPATDALRRWADGLSRG